MKIRCSSLGKIMICLPTPLSESQQKTFDAYDLRYKGTGKSLTQKQLITYADLLNRKIAKPKLSEGAKTYANNLAIAIYYGRYKNIESKYLEKGIEVEEESTDLVSLLKGQLLTTKSERKSNDWITGLCDIETESKIIDIKSSWDYTTFPILNEKIKSSLYEWQIRGYMWLYNKPYGEVAYCLTNTPFRLIDDEIRRLDWKENVLNQDGGIRPSEIHKVVRLISNHLFDTKALQAYCHQSDSIKIEWFEGFKDIPLRNRVRIYEFEREKEKEEQIKICVDLVRNYIIEKSKEYEFSRVI